MDGATDSTVEGHFLDCSYITTLQRVRAVMLARVRRCLNYDKTCQVMHDLIVQFMNALQIIARKVWGNVHNGTVLLPLSDLFIIRQSYYRRWVATLVWTVCKVYWENCYMCLYCTVWSCIEYIGQQLIIGSLSIVKAACSDLENRLPTMKDRWTSG